MFRKILSAALALLLATPAAAQTEHVVIGAKPASVYKVCAGDTLVLRRKMDRDLTADGTRLKEFSKGWMDRKDSTLFETDGATRLRFVENVPGKGWIYAPIDAEPCSTPAPAPVPSSTRFGVNLEGCTFVDNGSLCPTVNDVAWYVDTAGFQSVRLPFNGFQIANPVVMQRIVDLVDATTARKVPIILDRHDYKWPKPAEQVALWTSILSRVNDPELVMIDLMNEPRDFTDPVMTNDWLQWVRDTNLIVAGIRAAGFEQRILVEWPQWSASFRFDKKEGPKKACESAACAIDRSGGLVDPLNRIILSPHRYFDKDGAGQSATCVTDPLTAGGLREFAAAARKRGYRAILGEYALGGNKGMTATCQTRAPGIMAALKADSDVWLDAMAWGGGRAWTESYYFKIEPKKGTRASVAVPAYARMMAGDAR